MEFKFIWLILEIFILFLKSHASQVNLSSNLANLSGAFQNVQLDQNSSYFLDIHFEVFKNLTILGQGNFLEFNPSSNLKSFFALTNESQMVLSSVKILFSSQKTIQYHINVIFAVDEGSWLILKVNL